MSEAEVWTYDGWYDWRDEHPEPLGVFRVVCRGTYPPIVTNVTLDELEHHYMYNDDGTKTPSFQTMAPKVHKEFLLGKVTMDREGQITIIPRWSETMTVDPKTRNVTLQCKCHTDRGPCKYRLAINLDRLLVTLTQQISHMWTPHLYFGDERDRGPRKTIDFDFWPGEWFKGSLTTDEQATYDLEERKAVDAYRARRKPETVTDRKGNIIMTLP